MIALRSDSLVFETTAGDLVPCSVESVVVELIGDASSNLDPAMLRQAAAAVLHYFRTELDKTHVTVGEFAEALSRVLRSFGLEVKPNGPEEAEVVAANPANQRAVTTAAELDLGQLAAEPGESSELFFYSQLRAAMNDRLAKAPQVVRCSGLRRCVKRLAGARKWSSRCQKIEEQVVDYIRSCVSRERRDHPCTLVVR